MIFLLPTRSTRRYRGKYPDRINSISHSRSLTQRVIADFLGIRRPIHIELNDGRRYIVGKDAIHWDRLALNAEFGEGVRLREVMSQDLDIGRYDQMLALVREAR